MKAGPVLAQRTRAILGTAGTGEDETPVKTDAAQDETSIPLTDQRTRAILGDMSPKGDTKDGHDSDLFPSQPVAGVAATALSGHDADPLIGPDHSDTAHFGAESTSHDAASNALYQPIDHFQPVDHIDWHLGGLLS